MRVLSIYDNTKSVEAERNLKEIAVIKLRSCVQLDVVIADLSLKEWEE